MSSTTTDTAEKTPALIASHKSWAAVHAHDREGWLALMADDVVLEDPVGESYTNPDGTGLHGKEAVAGFYDANIGPNDLRVTCEETFPSSSPHEIAHILVLRSRFPNGMMSTVRGVFTYRVNDVGLLTNLRGYWYMDQMEFTKVEKRDQR